MPTRPIVKLTSIAGLLIALALLASQFGPVPLSMNRLWQLPFNNLNWQIWLNIRLPRVGLAILVGLALAVSGTVMQGLFRNPLADPGLLGISSGASLMVAFVLLIPFSVPLIVQLWLPSLAAFIGSALVTVLLLTLSRYPIDSLSALLLAGVAINALAGSCIGILSWISSDRQLRELSLWSMGSLGQAQWSNLLAAAIFIVPATLACLKFSRQLDILQLSEEDAHYAGVAVQQTRRQLLILNALLVGSAVAVSGIIGFVGLVVPHWVRKFFGSQHRWVLSGSALCGGFLLLLADTLARTLVNPAEIPVGLLTSLVGAPWFFWLIFKNRRK